MLSRVNTLAFNGLDTQDVDLQVQISSGMPAFSIVGLPDKAVAESRERVRAALNSIGISFPAKRVTINLAPADLLKEGSHYDLPVALGIISCLGIIPLEEVDNYIVLGELGLDASILPVNGILPAAIHANRLNKGLVCPAEQGSEAAWSGIKEILAPHNLLELINHFKGTQLIPQPVKQQMSENNVYPDMADVKGQESAKRALEIAAAGGHNMLMIGPPGSGKSMLAARLPGILPPLTPEEALETSIIHSIAGELKGGMLCFSRPFRAPHHNASTPALVGGGRRAEPGEISLAHNGVLFLDELPEFHRATLEALRQPLENGKITISRVNAHTTYPAKVQLIAAMNPCRCGHLGTPEFECPRAPLCAAEYQSKISGPLLDRIDIQIEMHAVSPWELSSVKAGETSAKIRERVLAARKIQSDRFKALGLKGCHTNADLKGKALDKAVVLDDEAQKLLINYADKNKISARAYHRILRLARTIADLQNNEKVLRMHIAEALSYRRMMPHYKK